MAPKKAPAKKGKREEPTPEPEAEPEPTPAPAPSSFDYDLQPTKEVIKPENQLVLEDKELDEEVTKQLTANNPNAPKNVARFSYKERMYKFEPMVDQLVVHYASDGYMLHKSSDEATRQMQLEKLEAEAMAEYEKQAAAPKEGEDGAEPDDSKQLRNQFNFSERAAQTVNNPMRDRLSATEPPNTNTFNTSCTQWEIYDAYMEDQARIALQKEMQKKQKQKASEGEAGAGEELPTKKEEKKPELMHGASMNKAAKVMERMVNQNSYDDIAQDFKYWEDQSDQFREGEGTLLPLWKFYNERAKRRHVTAIAWNPEYLDLFAVGYGSFDFVKQMSGLICCYSLKNPSHPEYTFTTDSGVMCLDFHPQHSSLLAVGLYDGTVMVYEVRNKINRPIRQSTVKNGKHTDPVWQVAWQEEDLSKSLNFFSVSSDGRVTLWTMSKSELTYQDIMELKLVSNASDRDPDDDTTLGSLAGGCCFNFNKTSDHLFVGHRGGQHPQVQQGVQQPVPRDLLRAPHGGVHGVLELPPPPRVPLRVGGLDREALGPLHRQMRHVV